MPSISNVKAREIIAFLRMRGFALVSQAGSHAKFKDAEGRRVIVPIHSRGSLPLGTLRSILESAGATKEELLAYLGRE